MKKQEIERIKQEHPEGLVMQTGACIYCGQIRQVEALNFWEAEDCNELATELCDCLEAKLYTAKKNQKENAGKIIDKQFGTKSPQPSPEEIVDLLKTGAALIIEQKLGKLTLTCEDGIEAKISATSKGAIKVERKKTEKRAEEA